MDMFLAFFWIDSTFFILSRLENFCFYFWKLSCQTNEQSTKTIKQLFIGGWGGENEVAPTGKSFRFVRACVRAGGVREINCG